MSLVYIVVGVILLIAGIWIYTKWTESLIRLGGVILAVVGFILLILGLIYLLPAVDLILHI